MRGEAEAAFGDFDGNLRTGKPVRS